MRLLFCQRQTRWGAGPGPVAIDREVVYSDMTDWRRFGRAPDFSERKMKDVITQRRDRRGCDERVWVCSVRLRLRELDHPSPLGICICGIGCDIVFEGVHKAKPCSGRLLVGEPRVAAWVMARSLVPSPEIVGWSPGARTCLRVSPGLLTVLECRFNKTPPLVHPGSLTILECHFNRSTHPP